MESICYYKNWDYKIDDKYIAILEPLWHKTVYSCAMV